MKNTSDEKSIANKKVMVFGNTMYYVDVGIGNPVVFLHGNPTSSFLWRNIIPHIQENARCLAPDLIGMGKSDKLDSGNYRFKDHVLYLDEWFNQLNLQGNITLVLHDWGSALGFYWAFRNQDKVKAIIYMEAIVQPREWSDFPKGRDKIFKMLRSEVGNQMAYEQNFFVETLLPKSIIRTLSEEEMIVYRAPFVTKESRKAPLDLARDLPIAGEPANVTDIVLKYGQWLSKSNIPKLLIVAEPGALLQGRSLEFARSWKNQKEVKVNGIHYIQEDSPYKIGVAIKEFYTEVVLGRNIPTCS